MSRVLVLYIQNYNIHVPGGGLLLRNYQFFSFDALSEPFQEEAQGF